MKRSMYRNGLYGLLSLVLVTAIGCSGGAPSESTAEQDAEAQQPRESKEIVFKQNKDEAAYAIEYTGDSAELKDGAGAVLARYTPEESGETKKIRIEDANGQVVGYVQSKGNTVILEDAEQQAIYTLRTGKENRYKLTDAAGEQIYNIGLTKKDGFMIRTPDKTLLYKVTATDNRVALKDADNETVLQSRSKIPALAIASFGLDELSKEQQGAMAYAISMKGNRQAKAEKKVADTEANDGSKADPGAESGDRQKGKKRDAAPGAPDATQNSEPSQDAGTESPDGA